MATLKPYSPLFTVTIAVPFPVCPVFALKHELNIMLVQVLNNLHIKYNQQPLNNNIYDIFISHYLFFETVTVIFFYYFINKSLQMPWSYFRR